MLYEEVCMENQKPAQSGQPEENYRHWRRHYHSGISGIESAIKPKEEME